MTESFVPIDTRYLELNGKLLRRALIFPPQPPRRPIEEVFASMNALNTGHLEWYEQRKTTQGLTQTTEVLPTLPNTQPLVPEIPMPSRRIASSLLPSLAQGVQEVVPLLLEPFVSPSLPRKSKEISQGQPFFSPSLPLSDLPPLPMPTFPKKPFSLATTLPYSVATDSQEEVLRPKKIESFADMLFVLLSPEKWRITQQIKKYFGTAIYKKFRQQNHERFLNQRLGLNNNFS